MLGVIEEITSLLWTRKYWEPGNFKLLVPFNDTHNQLLKEDNIIIKHGDTEAAEIWQKVFKKVGIEAKVAEIGSAKDGDKRGIKPGERIFFYDYH